VHSGKAREAGRRRRRRKLRLSRSRHRSIFICGACSAGSPTKMELG